MKNKPTFSFEFFPPRDETAIQALWRVLTELSSLTPRFVSVTYGAGGKTRENTHRVIARILRETHMLPAAHLTCVGQSQDELCDIVRRYWQEGVRHIVALRGDMPDMGRYAAHPRGFASTARFIEAIRAIGDFEVSVSAYPEKHPQSVSQETDLRLLQDKVVAGATRAITQFFFNIEDYLRLRERALKMGITIPIVPGIIHTTNFKTISAMAKKCGAHIPSAIADAYQGLEDDLPARRELAMDIALKQCDDLCQANVEHFHFYTLNQAKITKAVCTALIGAV